MRIKLRVKESEEKGAVKLVEALKCIPLAISQAGAYILQKSPGMNIEKYLSKFLSIDQKQTMVPDDNDGAPNVSRHAEIPKPVLSTWEISFQEIREQHSPAADLLALMSMFNCQDIPKGLVTMEWAKRTDTDKAFGVGERDFEKSMALLRSFSLVRAKTKDGPFEMHSLVRLATRAWLRSTNNRQKWESIAIKQMAKMFANARESWKSCATLLPHAEKVITYQTNDPNARLDRALVLENTGRYEVTKGNSSLGARRKQECLAIRRQLLHEDDIPVLFEKSSLPRTYMDQRRYKEPKELVEKMIETKTRVLGREHPLTLQSMANLGLIQMEQKLWQNAEKLQAQVVEMSKRVLGDEHRDTLSYMHNLASNYRSQGRWNEAEELQERVVKVKTRVLGLESPSTLNSMHNLAAIYRSRGRWEKAEELEKQIVMIKKRVPGPADSSTLTTMSNLAHSYKRQGRNLEAIRLMKKVADLRSNVIGKGHRDTKDSICTVKLWSVMFSVLVVNGAY